MSAPEVPEPRSAGSRIESTLTWLGGGQWRELGERHERSTHAITGVVVLLDAGVAWLVATLAVASSTRWTVPAIVPLTLLVGLLVAAVTRAIVSGPIRGWPGIVVRGAVAVALGVIVGELAALVLFSGTIDRSLDQQAARNADAAPAVTQASADLDRTRDARAGLDDAVEQARAHRDDALVVARCEYHPTPACPESLITGVSGAGPETRTADELLAGAQRELDDALAARDRRSPQLDSEIPDREQALAQARATAIADGDRGLGARWVAMDDHTVAGVGVLLLRLFTDAFFALLSLLPLIIKLWRGETTHDRSAAARAERDRAELQADTAIAVKRAEVRAAAEIMWADQQLATARLAVEAQLEIDRAQHHRRVIEALDGPVLAVTQHAEEESGPLEKGGGEKGSGEEGSGAQIAAEAETASRAAPGLPVGGKNARGDTSENLPARVESGGAAEPTGERGTPLIPTIPDVTRAAARWIRPLVPSFVARAMDTTTRPLRAARQVFEEVFEEVEEITFSHKRTHKVTVNFQDSPEQPRQLGSTATDTRVDPRPGQSSIRWPADDLPSGRTARERHAELTEQVGPGELPPAE